MPEPIADPIPATLPPDLPTDLRRALLLGATGNSHLKSMAERAIAVAAAPNSGDSGDRDCAAFALGLAQGLLLKAWREDPLDGGLAGHLLALHQRAPFLQGDHADLLHGLARAWKGEPGPAYCRRLEERGDPDRLLETLRDHCAREPEALPWRRLLFYHAQTLGRWDLLRQFLGSDPLLTNFPLVRDRLLADVAFSGADMEQAATLYAHSTQALPGSSGERLAAALLRLGRRDEALELLAAQLRAAPWDTTTLLRLHDAARGLDQATPFSGSATAAEFPGRLAILLYSWNKAEDLDATLESLFASRLPQGATVTVLDNGSTDHTAQVLARWSDRAGEMLRTVSLPVNIGAPAARNWLTSLDQVRRAQFVCFLDDDLELPVDWLERLALAQGQYPEAGVWGCRVVDHAAPWLMQHADLHLEPPRGRERFAMSSLHTQDCDFGQFDHMRPCSSVTGCCHIFARERLEAVGPFDIGFSPSQCDDLERDLRMVLGGGYAVCQGHLAVRHKKRTGRAAMGQKDAGFTARWNAAKLQDRFRPEEIQSMLAAMARVLEQDLAAKRQWLRENDLLGAR